eukprot:scaffold90627_cov63-Phaeocystis_antarctica.AAC.2
MLAWRSARAGRELGAGEVKADDISFSCLRHHVVQQPAHPPSRRRCEPRGQPSERATAHIRWHELHTRR